MDDRRTNLIAGTAIMLAGMICAAAVGALTEQGLGYALLLWAGVLG